MKTRTLLYASLSATLLLILSIQLGCKEENNDPDPDIGKYVWAVGTPDNQQYGTILFSPNAGDNWERQAEGFAALKDVYLSDVWAVDDKTVWAVGSSNTILKTTDGGSTWSLISVPNQKSNVELVSISLIGSNTIWVSGSLGTVYRSGDGGNNWTHINSEVLGTKYLQGIHAIDANTAYVVGNNNAMPQRGFIAYTTDAGLSWDSLVPAADYNKNIWIGVASSSQDNIIIYGGESHYMISHNGGQNWQNDSIEGTGGTDGADINCLKMLDDQIWWGAFDYDYIGQTKDAGITWEKQDSPGPYGEWLLGIDYYDENICVIVGESSNSNTGKIIKTADGGRIWDLVYPTEFQMRKVSFNKQRSK